MVSREDILRLAALARIKIQHEEIDEFTREVKRVLEFFDILSDVEPAENTVVSWEEGFMREDISQPSEGVEVLRKEKSGHVKAWPL